jgi:hypothetical protein
MKTNVINIKNPKKNLKMMVDFLKLKEKSLENNLWLLSLGLGH